MSVQAAHAAMPDGAAPSQENLIVQGSCKVWIWEFLLKHCSNGALLRAMAVAYPLPDSSLQLKRLLLLRSLSLDLSQSNFTDRTLETTSALFSLYRSQHCTFHLQVPVTHGDDKTSLYQFSFWKLHLSVRVECTIQHLRAETDDWPNFCKSLDKHWGNISDDTGDCHHHIYENAEDRDIYLKLKEEMWAVRKQPELRHGLLKTHKREYATRMIQVFLNDAWKDLGPLFLEAVVQNIKEGLYKPDGFFLDNQPSKREGPREAEKLLPKCNEDVNGSLATGCKVLNNVPSEVPENTCGADVRKRTLGMGEKQTEGGALNLEEENQTCISTPPWAGSPSMNEVVDSRRRSKRTFSCFEKNKTSVSGEAGFETPIILKAQKELKDCQADLNTVVQDPLPEALKIAEEAAKAIGFQEAQKQNDSVDGINQGLQVLSEENNVNNGDNHGVRQTRQKVNKNKTSIMDRNPTAHTIGWETSDDIDQSSDDQSPSQSRRVRLPQLRRLAGQHLTSTSKNEPRRRKFRRWILEEENVLRKEVERLGKGHWKHILNAHKDIFEGRTEVDLKDKWRNIERSEGIS